MSVSEYCYDKEGLFLAFLSYPYHLDGKELYDEVIRVFFDSHKARYSGFEQRDGMNSSKLYIPTAYRMFGTQGMLVLSLIDDYSFCSRYFNKNHIRTLLEVSGIEVAPDLFKFKSLVVTGVQERSRDLQDEDLGHKAEKTFLRKEKKYPFVGVIRLKIDHQLLRNGVEAIRIIKRKIEGVRPNPSDCHFDYIAVDCFDNDEMTVVAFSDSIARLMVFMGGIRDLRNDGSEAVEFLQAGSSVDKHLFASTYINLGYDVACNLEDVTKNPDFFDISPQETTNTILNCLIETRPGHRDVYERSDVYSKTFRKVTERIASGGSVLKAEITLADIHKLEALCKNETTIRDVRKIRVSLQNLKEEPHRLPDLSNHAKNFKAPVTDNEILNRLKKDMKSLGVSKMVRDRLLALFELYDCSRDNLIQTLFFDELSCMGSIFTKIINDFYGDPETDIRTIECILDSEITNIESACYDRVHNRKYAENLLEYSGGIQQHLTSFGFAYSIINTIFTNQDDNDIYTIITGADRVSSERTHLNLNINHVLFPELFVTTVWKEASNRNIKLLGEFSYADVEMAAKDIYPQADLSAIRGVWRFFEVLNTWHVFVENSSSSGFIKNYILQETQMLLRDDEVFAGFKSIMNQDLLLYMIKDYVVCHFAFQRDFEKMWHFSFKVLLQTTNSYYRLGKFKRVHLIYMLLRLFMIGRRLDKVNGNDFCARFISEQKHRPFDTVLQDLWIECYSKIEEIADILFRVTGEYGLVEVSEYQIIMCECNIEMITDAIGTSFISDTSEDKLKIIVDANMSCLNRRSVYVKDFEGSWKERRLIDCSKYDSSPADFIICLFNTYVAEIYKLDLNGNSVFLPVKSVPRDKNGEVLNTVLDAGGKGLRDDMISILCDTTGGFFLPREKTREEYFVLRTLFYRSLWNFRMKNGNVG